MARWGVRIAKATGAVLHILWVESGTEHRGADDLVWLPWSAAMVENDPQWAMISDALADSGTPDVNVCMIATRSRHLTVLSVEKKWSPGLLGRGLGKNAYARRCPCCSSFAGSWFLCDGGG